MMHRQSCAQLARGTDLVHLGLQFDLGEVWEVKD